MNMQSEQIAELATALSKAQGEMCAPELNKQGYGYKYADLNAVWKVCRGPLKAHGLSIIQIGRLVDGKQILITRLSHSSGQWIESAFVLPDCKERIATSKGKNTEMQEMGSNITYLKRYALTALLGLNGDEDIDAADLDRKHEDLEKKVTPNKREETPSRSHLGRSEISAKEVVDLEMMLNKLPERKAKFLSFMEKEGIPSIANLPRETYDKMKASFLNDLATQESVTK